MFNAWTSQKASKVHTVSKLAIVLIWNIQSPHEDNISSCERYKISGHNARSSYDSCRFGIGRFRAETTNYEQCLHPSDTFGYRIAHNNLFLTLCVIDKLRKLQVWFYATLSLLLCQYQPRREPWERGCANTFIFLTFKIPLILTIYGHLAGNLNFFN